MSKIKLLFLLFVLTNFLSCGDGNDSNSPSMPSHPDQQNKYLELTSLFPESYNNSFVNGILTIKNTSQKEITNIKINIPLPAAGLETRFGITGNNLNRNTFPKDQGDYPGLSGTCPKDKKLSPGSTCMVDLSGLTLSKDVNKTIVHPVSVIYTVDGKSYAQQVNLSLKIKDRKEVFVANILLGKTLGERRKQLIFTNLSNFDKASEIKIEPVISGFVSAFKFSEPDAQELNSATSFCLSDPKNFKNIDDINPQSRCMIIVSYTQPIALAKIQETYNLSYNIDGKPQTAQFTIGLEPNAPGDILKILNTNFHQIQVISGTEKTVQIKIVNPPKGNNAHDLKLERLKPAGWDAELRLDNANSTCVTKKNLVRGSSCFYDLIISPFASEMNYQKQLVFKYKNSSNNLIELPFILQGSIDVLPPGAFLKKPTVDTPVYIKSNAIAGDEFYSYSKRTPKKDAQLAMSYPDFILNKIPQDTRTHVQHVPWSFRDAWNTNAPTKLKDIVPDREIIDGKSYIKLYHGSTSDAKNIFLQGAKGIDFSLAGKVPGGLAAFGNGFYLSSSMNESKAYACQSLKTKPGKMGLNGLLLVVGIEENDIIKGRPHAPSDRNGKARNKDLFFATGQPNQFVFFDNIRPYLKILKVVDLPASGFYMSKDLNEGDGFAKGDQRVENDFFQSYKCKP
jgi:hypothetical protein